MRPDFSCPLDHSFCIDALPTGIGIGEPFDWLNYYRRDKNGTKLDREIEGACSEALFERGEHESFCDVTVGGVTASDWGSFDRLDGPSG